MSDSHKSVRKALKALDAKIKEAYENEIAKDQKIEQLKARLLEVEEDLRMSNAALEEQRAMNRALKEQMAKEAEMEEAPDADLSVSESLAASSLSSCSSLSSDSVGRYEGQSPAATEGKENGAEDKKVSPLRKTLNRTFQWLRGKSPKINESVLTSSELAQEKKRLTKSEKKMERGEKVEGERKKEKEEQVMEGMEKSEKWEEGEEKEEKVKGEKKWERGEENEEEVEEKKWEREEGNEEEEEKKWERREDEMELKEEGMKVEEDEVEEDTDQRDQLEITVDYGNFVPDMASTKIVESRGSSFTPDEQLVFADAIRANQMNGRTNWSGVDTYLVEKMDGYSTMNGRIGYMENK